MRWRTLTTFLMLSLSGACSEEPSSALPLRVLSYNIHHGEGMDGKLDLERIAAIIRSARPDLVALQEVDRKTLRSGGVDQAEVLGRLTGMQSVFGRAMDYEQGEYGPAVLAKVPILRSRTHPLPRVTGAENRVVLEVSVALQRDLSSQTVGFWATHLEDVSDETDRLAGADRISQLVRVFADQPSILAGDLNAARESKTMVRFAEDWSDSSDSIQATFPADQPSRQLDYVLFRPRHRWRVVEIRVLEEDEASDHRPILAVLELLP